MGFLDNFRSSKEEVDISGMEMRVEQAELIDALQTQVKESSSQLEMVNRAAEEIGWQLLSSQRNDTPGDKELTLENRQKRNKETERMYREDALIRRGVNISNEYVFGRGFQKPSARDPRVQRVIDSFWADAQNMKAFTSLDAQLQTNIDLECHGELFFVIFDNGRWGDLGIKVTDREGEGTSGLQDNGNSSTSSISESNIASAFESMGIPVGEANFEYTEDLSGGKYQVEITGDLPDSAVKISKLHPNEITDVIRDTKSSLITRFYRRERVAYWFDYKQGQPVPKINSQGILDTEVTYYADFDTPAPDDYENAPPEYAMHFGKIMHRTINKGSHSLRGNSDVWVSVRWARLLNEYFEWRVTLLRALATFPFKRKVKGGMSQVLQRALSMSSTQNPMNIGTPGDYNARGVPLPGSVLTENESENLEQFKTSSNAGEATADILSLRAQAGLAMGLPPHYLGDVGSANLANATAMEFPVLKRFQTRQEFYEKCLESMLDHAINKAVDEGLIPKDADLTYKDELPEIQQRVVPELINSINQIAARLDPFSINFKLKRFLLLYGLSVLGINNPQKIVQDIYPPSAEADEQARMQQLTTGGAFGGVPTGIGQGTSPDGTNGAAAGQGEIPVSDLDPMKNKKQEAQTVAQAESDASLVLFTENDKLSTNVSPDEIEAARQAYIYYHGDMTEAEIAQVPETAFKDWAVAVSTLIKGLEKVGVEEIERSNPDQ